MFFFAMSLGPAAGSQELSHPLGLQQGGATHTGLYKPRTDRKKLSGQGCYVVLLAWLELVDHPWFLACLLGS